MVIFPFPLRDGVQHYVYHVFPFLAEIEVFPYLVMVAGSDIRQFVFEGSGIFAQEVVGSASEQVCNSYQLISPG